MSLTRVEGSPELEAAICELRSIIKQEDFIGIKFEKDEFGHDKVLDVSKLMENDIYNGAVQRVGQEVVNQTVMSDSFRREDSANQRTEDSGPAEMAKG